MAYLDPASNPGSKPQRLSDRIAKVALGNKTTNCGILCKLLRKTLFTRKTFLVLFPRATFLRKITEPLRKKRVRINYL